MPGATLTGFLFRKAEEPLPEALTAQVLPHPHQINIEPVPIGCADHAADDLPIRRLEDITQALAAVISRPADVEILKPSADDLPGGFFEVVDLNRFILMHKGSSFGTIY